MTLVFFKMTGINAEYFKVKLNLFKRWHQKVCKKKKNLRLWKGKTNLSLGSLFGITWDRSVYPIHKLMIDSYSLALLNWKLKNRVSLEMAHFEPHLETTCPRGLITGLTQTGLYSHR